MDAVNGFVYGFDSAVQLFDSGLLWGKHYLAYYLLDCLLFLYQYYVPGAVRDYT